jgi:GNAT superfamily N-acetyltransferase
VSAPAAPALPADLSGRQLGSNDVVASADLVSACDQTYLESAPQGWRPPSEAQERGRWQENLSDPARWSWGVFDSSATLVALVAFKRAPSEEGKSAPELGHLTDLFVHPSRWHEGIASSLLAGAEAAMAERGLRDAILRTPEWAPARGFYEARGWHPTEVREYAESWDMWTIRCEKSLPARVGLAP